VNKSAADTNAELAFELVGIDDQFRFLHVVF